MGLYEKILCNFLVAVFISAISLPADSQDFSSSYSKARKCDKGSFIVEYYSFSIDNHLNLKHDFLSVKKWGFHFTAYSILHSRNPDYFGPVNYRTYLPIGYEFPIIARYPKIVPSIGINFNLLTINKIYADHNELQEPWIDIISKVDLAPFDWMHIALNAGFRTNVTGISTLPMGGFYAGIGIAFGSYFRKNCRYYASISRKQVRENQRKYNSLSNPDIKILEDYMYLNPNGKYIQDVKLELTERYYNKVCKSNRYKLYVEYRNDIPKESEYYDLVTEEMASIDWISAKSNPSVSKVQNFLDKYPSCNLKSEAEEFLEWLADNPLEVRVDYPKSIKGGSSPYSNVSSPFFKWKVTFSEKGGKVGYKVKGSGWYYNSRGEPYGLEGRIITTSTIHISPGGSDSYETWFSGSKFRGGYILFTFEGEDDAGRKIKKEVKIYCE